MGRKMETIDNTSDVPVSTVETIGLPIPAVDTVEAKRVVLEELQRQQLFHPLP